MSSLSSYYITIEENAMADYNVRLSQFHQRIWQHELGLPATIDEHGCTEREY